MNESNLQQQLRTQPKNGQPDPIRSAENPFLGGSSQGKGGGLHFSKAVGASLFLLLVFTGMIFKTMVHLTPEDRAQYEKLMNEADPKSIGGDTKTVYSVAQNRSGIRKDYFFTKNSQRLHLRIMSDNAILMMDQGVEGSALMEKMQNVVCLMQEELYYLLPNGKEALKGTDGQLSYRTSSGPKQALLSPEEAKEALPYQRLRYFTSQNASYHYQIGQFIGETVKIVHYTMPGHDLPYAITTSRASLRGTADSVELIISHGNPHFKAFGFKAQICAAGIK